MSRYKTGDDTVAVVVLGESARIESPESDISYNHETIWPESIRNRESQPAHGVGNRSRNQPTTPSPGIRKELAKTIDRLCLAADAMQTAHEGQGVDVIELANAVEEYRGCVEILWRYREFGMEAWRSVIVFCQQALCENMHDEEMTRQQCVGLKKIAGGYLSNRLLAKEDVKEVMLLLTSSDFDSLLFFSQVNEAE